MSNQTKSSNATRPSFFGDLFGNAGKSSGFKPSNRELRDIGVTPSVFAPSWR